MRHRQVLTRHIHFPDYIKVYITERQCARLKAQSEALLGIEDETLQESRSRCRYRFAAGARIETSMLLRMTC